MKRRYRNALPIAILLAGLAGLVGCTAANKEAVLEDISSTANSKQENPQTSQTAETAGTGDQSIQEVVVPVESPVAEDAKFVAATSAKDAGTDATASARQTDGANPLHTIHFDFDRYAINDSEKNLLGENAKWLASKTAVRVRIEGHADERGETEYNLALGDRRARSVKRFLEDLGVAPERMSTISYGEEKPTALGHNEDAWAKNRRAEFETLN